MAIEAQRIYAGTAGGKKYFYGDDGKLYDEAGNEQPEKLAEVLRANFPPLPANKQKRKRTKPQLVQPTPPADDNKTPDGDEWYDHDNDPSTPPIRRFRAARAIGGAITSDILRAAFPELHSAAAKYRKIFKGKPERKGKQPKSQNDKEKKKADRKRGDRELSLKIEQVASHVRTNGELLRQQLTAQQRTIELLEKLTHGTKSNGEKTEGALGKLSGVFSSMKGWLLPALGVAATVGLGATALWQSGKGKQNAEDIWHNEDVEKYGQEKADELARVRNMNTLQRIQDLFKRIPQTGRPRAKTSVLNDEFAPFKAAMTPQTGDTPATREAEARKPGGKTVEIKGENISFEARQILLDARSIKINSSSSSYGMTLGSGAGGVGGGAGSPGVNMDTPGSAADNQVPGQGGRGGGSGGATEPQPDGLVPPQAQFKPDIATPWSPGGTQGPGQGGISGGMGAETLGGRVLPRLGSAEAVTKETAAAMQFRSPNAGSFGTLAEQRKGYMDQINASPELKERAMALMMAEEGGDSKSRRAVLETAMNRAAAMGVKDIGKVLGDTRYYQPYQNGSYEQHLARVRSDAKLRDTLSGEIGEVGAGSNISQLGTHNGSANVKANALARKDTLTYEGDNKEGFFRKDKNAWYHGAGTVARESRWAQQTQAAMKAEEERRKNLKMANADNTKNLIGGKMSSDMFSSKPIASMKALGDVSATADKMEEKNDVMVAKPWDDPIKTPLAPYVNETNKVGGSGITTDLKEEEKGSWWGEKPRAAQPMFGERSKAEELEKQVNPMAKGLGIDDLDKQLRPIDSINPSPGEIPEGTGTSGSYHRGSQDMPENDEPAEKSNGSQTRINDSNGALKPKPIRKVDLDKYYPQYPKTTEAGSVVGMTVA